MLWAAATAIRHGSKIDSIGFYVNGEGSKLSVARELALRVLVVPAGEASSERVFSCCWLVRCCASSLRTAHTLRSNIL
jgi:hypothetical protein